MDKGIARASDTHETTALWPDDCSDAHTRQPEHNRISISKD